MLEGRPSSPCEPQPSAGEQEHMMKAVVYGRYGSPDVLELTGIDKAVLETIRCWSGSRGQPSGGGCRAGQRWPM